MGYHHHHHHHHHPQASQAGEVFHSILPEFGVLWNLLTAWLALEMVVVVVVVVSHESVT